MNKMLSGRDNTYTNGGIGGGMSVAKAIISKLSK
jgi:hypothetical protein